MLYDTIKISICQYTEIKSCPIAKNVEMWYNKDVCA